MREMEYHARGSATKDIFELCGFTSASRGATPRKKKPKKFDLGKKHTWNIIREKSNVLCLEMTLHYMQMRVL